MWLLPLPLTNCSLRRCKDLGLRYFLSASASDTEMVQALRPKHDRTSNLPPPYREPHWNVFRSTPYVPQGAVGDSPAQWVADWCLPDVPQGILPLPAQQLTRTAVKDICRDLRNPVLFGYVCAMAWGLQGADRRTKHVTNAWSERGRITENLESLRAGGHSRCTTYNLFLNHGRIGGLGPSFFTKLIYFFSPGNQFYIMDQWTGKSVNLLTGQNIVRMGGETCKETPAPYNKCGNYQAFCEEIDFMAAERRMTGEQIEEALFSKDNGDPGPWRNYVKANWTQHQPQGRYKRRDMHRHYPHIPQACF